MAAKKARNEGCRSRRPNISFFRSAPRGDPIARATHPIVVRSTSLICWTAPMTLTTEQSRSLVDAIATTASLEALVELQRLARREHLFDPGGGFLELLIAVRHDALTRAGARAPRDAGRVAAGAVPRGKGAIARSRAACVVGLHAMERARLTAERSALLLA